MPDWVETGFLEYARRLPAEFSLDLKEIAMPTRRRNAGTSQLVEREATAMLAQVSKSDWVISLDVGGRQFDTEQLAMRLQALQQQGRDVVFLVGGPDGLGEPCQQRADEKWSLSSLTLPHPLVRVVLAEQFYRAWSILNGHPYHRA